MRSLVAVLVGMVLMVSGIYSSSAYAIFDAQLLYGHRRTTFESKSHSETLGASEVQLAAHLDPIPFVPVALGLYYINHAYNPEKDGDVYKLDELKGSQIGAEIYAWLPILSTNFSLFGKFGYTFWGEYEGSNKALLITDGNTTIAAGKTDVDLKMTGMKLGVGLKWSPIALVSALIEADYQQEKWEFDEIKIAGNKASTAGFDDIDAKGWTILIGAQVGL
jgi:hypothetical protein